jgi:REP element-mobilizing transposase RayT
MRGGQRKGAGRKPVERRKSVAHRSREHFSELLAGLATIRVEKNVYNLRSQRSYNALKRAFKGGANRFGTRLVHYSVQGNHIHAIIESPDTASLMAAMKGLSVRIAHKMNAMMGRKGKVIGDRYHVRMLRGHRAARNAVRYVRENHRKHFAPKTNWREGQTNDVFSSWGEAAIELPKPRTTVLRWVYGKPD